MAKYISVSFISIFLGLAILAGVVTPYDPWQRFEPFQSPETEHVLGTNDMGHDIFSGLLYGSRVTILTGIITACIAVSLGTVVGIVAGYFQGITEEILMGVTDVVLMIPRLPVIIIFAAFMRPSFWIIILVLGLLWWPATARVVRSKTLQVREAGYIPVNTCLGIPVLRILCTDMFPNLFQVVVPKFILTVASAMVSEASISFLGLGDPTVKSWGMMLNYAFNRGGFWNGMWWWYLPPGLCLVALVTAVKGVERFFHKDLSHSRSEELWELRS